MESRYPTVKVALYHLPRIEDRFGCSRAIERADVMCNFISGAPAAGNLHRKRCGNASTAIRLAPVACHRAEPLRFARDTSPRNGNPRIACSTGWSIRNRTTNVWVFLGSGVTLSERWRWRDFRTMCRTISDVWICRRKEMASHSLTGHPALRDIEQTLSVLKTQGPGSRRRTQREREPQPPPRYRKFDRRPRRGANKTNG